MLARADIWSLTRSGVDAMPCFYLSALLSPAGVHAGSSKGFSIIIPTDMAGIIKEELAHLFSDSTKYYS